jgi:hypothetical protein
LIKALEEAAELIKKSNEAGKLSQRENEGLRSRPCTKIPDAFQ